MKNVGRWVAAGFAAACSLIWLWLELAYSARFLMLCLWGINILAAFGMGVLYDRVRALSFRDDLTPAYNRRFLTKVMPSFLAATTKKQRSLTVTLIDCDDFKKINDEHGHHTGDKVLQAIALLLSQNMRYDDYLVRWGGDEFLLIASDMEQHSVQTVLDRLNDELDSMSARMNMSLSVSAGTAAFPSDATGLEDLIRIADQRMYQSKLRRKEPALLSSLDPASHPEPKQIRQA